MHNLLYSFSWRFFLLPRLWLCVLQRIMRKDDLELNLVVFTAFHLCCSKWTTPALSRGNFHTACTSIALWATMDCPASCSASPIQRSKEYFAKDHQPLCILLINNPLLCGLQGYGQINGSKPHLSQWDILKGIPSRKQNAKCCRNLNSYVVQSLPLTFRVQS